VVQVVPLDWEDESAMGQSVAAIRAQGQVDLIVASDCIYPGGKARVTQPLLAQVLQCLDGAVHAVADGYPDCLLCMPGFSLGR
jgi:hypothetical protein